jgi:rfaE bifunctional protein nucleotidyltransferase chain/domain
LGHIDYLEKSSQKGSYLIVGVNTDRSVSSLKGPERPVNVEYARARLLAALGFVSLVIIFDEDTPLGLIKNIMPDVLVKGNDYSISTIVGSKEVIENGGKVETVELVPNFSTTEIIQKLKK